MLGSAYVETIHDSLVMILWPGTDPITAEESRSVEMIESAVGRPFASAFGEDAYPTVLDKAIALFHSLISNHPFWNGNKRTAVIAFDHFLMANGYFLALENQEMYELAEKTATYKARRASLDESVAEIIAAVRDRIVPFEVLEQAKDEVAEFGQLHQRLIEIRSWLRSHPFNSIRP